MSSSSTSNNGTPASWSVSGSFDNFIDVEKVVFKNNLPLVLACALSASAYSYFMINPNINSAINRAVFMSLSAFFASSIGNMLEMHGYLDPKTSTSTYVEAGLIPVLYYMITTKQFQVPDTQSQVLKTGIIATILAELATPMVGQYVSKWQAPSSPSLVSSKASKGK